MFLRKDPSCFREKYYYDWLPKYQDVIRFFKVLIYTYGC